jgi:hypothetical protein
VRITGLGPDGWLVPWQTTFACHDL